MNDNTKGEENPRQIPNDDWKFFPETFVKNLTPLGVVLMGGGVLNRALQGGDFLPSMLVFVSGLILFYISSWGKRQ